MAAAFEIGPFPLHLQKQPDKVRWLPGAVQGGTEGQLLAVGSWDVDLKVAALEILSLELEQEEESMLERPTLHSISSWQHSGRVQELQALALDSSRALLATGSSDGHISTAVFEPGAPSSEKSMSVRSVHDGAVNGMDVREDKKEVVSVGEDGRICRLGLDQSNASPTLVADVHRTLAPSAVRWTSSSGFVTAGLGGGLQLWDTRQATRKAHSPPPWNPPVVHANCIDVHPSRKHICAVGCSDGTVVAWDLRWQQAPVTVASATALEGPSFGRVPASRGGGAFAAEGDVWEVQFDRLTQYAAVVGGPQEKAKLPPLLLATEDGRLASVGGGAAVVLLEDVFPVTTFDVDADFGQDVIAGMERECLVYFRRPRFL